MDPQTQLIKDFTNSMRAVRESLGSLIQPLYRRPEVKTVTQYDIDVSLATDFGVSADLRNGALVDFWLEVFEEDIGWRVEFSVLRHDPDEDGCHKEVEFPDKVISTADEMPTILIAAINELKQRITEDSLFR